jgi:hypothetical protein
MKRLIVFAALVAAVAVPVLAMPGAVRAADDPTPPLPTPSPVVIIIGQPS